MLAYAFHTSSQEAEPRELKVRGQPVCGRMHEGSLRTTYRNQFSFCYVGSENQTQIVELGSKLLYHTWAISAAPVLTSFK